MEFQEALRERFVGAIEDATRLAVTAATGFTNAGTMTLTQIENEGNSAVLTISSGTLTNTGTITSEAGTGAGTRTLQGSLTNKGTLAIDTSTSFNGTSAAFKNEGAVNILTGATLLLPSGRPSATKPAARSTLPAPAGSNSALARSTRAPTKRRERPRWCSKPTRSTTPARARERSCYGRRARSVETCPKGRR